MSQDIKRELSTRAAADASERRGEAALHAGPNAGSRNSGHGTAACRRMANALDTGTRGWRWLVTSAVLIGLPFCVAAAQSQGLLQPLDQPALTDDLPPIVPVAADLELGVRLSTLEEVRADLRRASDARPPALRWAEVFFDTVDQNGSLERDGERIAIPGRIAAETPARFTRDAPI